MYVVWVCFGHLYRSYRYSLSFIEKPWVQSEGIWLLQPSQQILVPLERSLQNPIWSSSMRPDLTTCGSPNLTSRINYPGTSLGKRSQNVPWETSKRHLIRPMWVSWLDIPKLFSNFLSELIRLTKCV